MEFFLRHKIIILRTAGVFLLLIGFLVRFWVMPQEVISQSDIAAANVARMESSVIGNLNSKKSSQANKSHFLKELKDTQRKQLEYLTIIVMLVGIGSLGYSFIGKKQD